MQNTKKRMAIFLALWVAVLPATPALAQRGAPPPPPAPMFHPEGQYVRITKDSGLRVASAVGHWHKDGESTRGGDAVAVSPWGERLEARYAVDDGGFEAVINERVTIALTIDEYGHADELIVRANGEESVVDLAAQAQRVARGSLSLPPPDRAVYAALIEALAQEHSQAFWRALADEYDATAPAGCGLPVFSCSLGIIGWLGSLSGLVGICGAAVASAGALTPGCLAAILVHPTVSTSAALACGNALDCLETEWENSQGDEGCSGPGGQE